MPSDIPNKVIRFSLTFVKYFALGIIGLGILIWLVSPYIVRPVANNILESHHIKLTDKSSVRYNPFLSKISVSNLKFENEAFTLSRANIEANLHRMFFDTLYVKTLELEGAKIDITKNENILKVAGFEIPSSSTEEKPIEPQTPAAKKPINYTFVAPNIRFSDIDIRFQEGEQQHTFYINTLTINNINATQQQQSADFTLDAKINNGDLSIESDISFDQGKGKIRTQLSLQQFELADIEKELADTLDKISGKVSLRLTLTAEIDDQQIGLVANDSELIVSDVQLRQEDLHLSLDQHNTKIPQATIQLLNQEIQDIRVESELSFGSLLLNTVNQNDTIIAWKTLALSAITFDAKQALEPASIDVAIQRITATGIEASRVGNTEADIPALAQIGKIDIDTVTYQNSALGIKTINIDSIKNQIIIDKTKEIQTLVKLAQEQQAQESVGSPSPTEVDTQNEANEDTLPVKLGSFSLTGENEVFFHDQSVTPSYKRTFFIDTLSIQDVDNQADTLSPFEIVGRSNEYAKVNLKGAVNPFSDNVNLRLAGNLREVSLPAVSSYIKDALGFELKTGQLDSDIDVAVLESELDGKIKLHLRGVDMSAADSTDTTSLKDQSAIPLNVALGMLKDKKGNIELSVPMKGSVDDPSFGLRNFLVLVTKKAAMSQAKSYLMKTFVPYANVISVAVAAGEFALKLRFEDLPYPVSSTTVSEDQEKYAQEFIALMTDKPKTQVKICGVATSDEAGYTKGAEITDAAALESIKKIAQERAENFKKYVVTQGNIASSRLLLCNPKVNFNEEALPRIEISI